MQRNRNKRQKKRVQAPQKTRLSLHPNLRKPRKVASSLLFLRVRFAHCPTPDDKSSMIAFFKQYLKEKGVECPECRTYEDYLRRVGSEVAMEKQEAGGDARWTQMVQAQLEEDESFWKGDAPEVPPERLLPLEDLLEFQELLKKRDEGVPYLDILREAHSKGIDVEKLLGKEIPALHCDCAAGEGAEGQQQCSAAAPPLKEDDDCIAHYDDEEDYY